MLGFIALVHGIALFGQTTVREKEFSVTQLDREIELIFDVAVSVRGYDAINNEEVTIILDENKANGFVLENIAPAKIIRLEYHYLNGLDTQVRRSFIAKASASTGAITVYFNHLVDTSVVQTQNATNLGNLLDSKLIEYIDGCVSTLDIAIYNSYSASATDGIAGAINAAYARGVQVRVIFDGSTSSVMIPLLHSGIPKLASPSGSSYGIMHNKFVVFDAANSNANVPMVWTGSTNWTTAQIEGPDKNSAIVIQDQALALGYTLEFEEMWGSSSMTPNSSLSKFGPNKTDNTPHTYLIGGKTVNSYFSPSDGVTGRIIEVINSASSDIDIATMLITRSDISSAILNKFTSGLSTLNIVVDSQNPSGNQIGVLQAGLPNGTAVVYSGSGIMHHKFMCVDNFDSSSDPQVLLGSHNWSNSAETRNDENTLIVHDANITNQYYQAFAYLFTAAGGVLNTNEAVVSSANFVLYPNPSTGLFYISAKENNFGDSIYLSVYDVLGNKIVEKHTSDVTNEAIDLSNQARGMYFVSITSEGKTGSFKLIRN